MKTRSTRSLRRLLLKIRFYCDYAEQIGQLEKALARKPEKLQLDIMGSGELPHDVALLIRSVLLSRSAKTHLITNARSSLQGGAALIWLMGDTRLVREDAHLYFQKPDQDDEDDDEAWKTGKSDEAEADIEEVDHEQVLQYINNFLPVKELAGRAVGLETLRQFGLVDSEKADSFLNSAFARRDATAEPPEPGQGKVQVQESPGQHCPEQSKRDE
jgi:hypothetical protein